MRRRRTAMGGAKAKPNEIDDFQDTKGVDDEERNKPLLLPTPCRMPQGKAF